MASYAAQVVADGAVAYWRLAETSGTSIASEVAGPPAGAIAGAVTLGVPGALADGTTAMTFNPAGAADGRIAVANGAYAAIGTGSATLECWAKVRTVPTSIQTFAGIGVPFSVSAHGMQLNVDATNVFCNLQNATSLIPVTTPRAILFDGNWHHLVAVLRRGASDVLELWVDAVLKATVTPGGPAGSNMTVTGQSIFGNNPGLTNDLVNGDVDEIAFYKSALSQAQIEAHYAARLEPATSGRFANWTAGWSLVGARR